jgi:hypothetical protein
MRWKWTPFSHVGQGTGPVRVPRATIAAFRERYWEWIVSPQFSPPVIDQWDREGAEILERVREIGRLAALKATQDARIEVSTNDFIESATAVEAKSMTLICPILIIGVR